MPIFEFKCLVCGAVKEVIQSYSAAAPYCDTQKLGRTNIVDYGPRMVRIPSVAALSCLPAFHHPGGDVHMRKRGMKVTVSGDRM